MAVNAVRSGLRYKRGDRVILYDFRRKFDLLASLLNNYRWLNCVQ